MANGDNDSGVQELSDGNPAGVRMGSASTELIGFLGATPINQETAGTAAPAVDPGANTSALVASIQSIAVAAASLANRHASILASFGFTT